jgi:hypothetical protein
MPSAKLARVLLNRRRASACSSSNSRFFAFNCPELIAFRQPVASQIWGKRTGSRTRNFFPTHICAWPTRLRSMGSGL